MAVKTQIGIGPLEGFDALVGGSRVIDVGQAEINFAAIKLRDEGAGSSCRLDAHLHLELVIHQLPDDDAGGIEDRALRIAGDDAHLLRLGCRAAQASAKAAVNVTSFVT